MKLIVQFYSQYPGTAGQLVDAREVQAESVAYDGCHKIYLIQTQADLDLLTDLGYAIHPLDRLQDIWDISCPLRFVSLADLSEDIVPQCAMETIRFVVERE